MSIILSTLLLLKFFMKSDIMGDHLLIFYYSMLLFLDTEFTSLTSPSLVSIALVSECGNYSTYQVLSDYNKNSESSFFRNNVAPLLANDNQVTEGLAATNILQWFKSLPASSISVTADYHGDFTFLHQLLLKVESKNQILSMYSEVPFNILIDNLVKNESLSLNINGSISPAEERLVRKASAAALQELERVHSSSDAKQHHALFDALALRAGWLAAKSAILPPLY